MGVLSTGNHLTHVSFVAGQEALTSEAGYPTSLKGTWVHGSDYIKTDADGAKSRLEVDSLVKDTATGGLVRYRYTGVVDMSGAAGKVLRDDAGAATTDFGEICEYALCGEGGEIMFAFLLANVCACVRACGPVTHVKFETGHPQLKVLENKVFVGSGRFILEAGKPVTVEYKISEVSI